VEAGQAIDMTAEGRSSSHTPAVSVIIPTYNREAFLTEAIDSVLRQTWKDLETIVVDDGSTDGSRDVLRRYGHRITPFYNRNEGPSKARNFGTSKARGRFLAFLDSDDLWEPNKLDVQMGVFESHPEVSMVCCGSYVLGDARRRRSPVQGNHFGDLFLTLYQKSFVNTSSVVLTRDSFLRAGPFEEAMRTAEDYDLWLRVARDFPIAYLGTPLVGIRKHSDELSKNKLDLRQNAIRVIQRHFDPKRVPQRIYRRRLSDLYLYLGRGYLRVGDSRKARASFQQAMALTPLRLRSVRYLLRTLFPSRG
jgi:glycosyltransferase involved in cell wall biosynthesis